MRTRFAICSAACAAALASVPALAQSASVLPQCTVIAVQTVDAINSKTARPGDFFRFQTINSVDYNGRIVLAEHTLGWGIVTVASPAAKGGRAGSLVLEPLYFKMPNGERMGVVLDHNSSALQASGPSDSLPAYLGAIPVVGVGAAVGAFDYFHHGKDITVQKGTIFAVFPSDDPSVAGCRKSKKAP
ncbi:MAG TPA: hypothetical protein VKT51_02175 [Candidatus Eremiobacteraceae bacterium]|nr:hypothetical protein [Candidatus Eremiobacteraceae bacterium]